MVFRALPPLQNSKGKPSAGALNVRGGKILQMLPFVWTRNSAIADKLRDAFRGQSRSPNMIPFDMLGTVSY